MWGVCHTPASDLFPFLLLTVTRKIEVPKDDRNSKSGNMTSLGENGLNIRTNASPKWDRTRCPEE